MTWDPEDYNDRRVEKYNQLPEAVKDWLEGLRENDIIVLKKAMDQYTKVAAITGFFKWFWIVVGTAFLGAVGLWEAILKVIGWIRPGLIK
jgi:hypothetical protein